MFSLLAALVTGGFTAFNQEREHKNNLRKVKAEAQIRRIQSGDDNAAKLDELSIAQRGWKDEYLLLITTAPLVLCFIPDMAHYVELGFRALALIPEYYWYGLAMVYIDTFGFRRMVRVAVECWLEKRFGSS